MQSIVKIQNLANTQSYLTLLTTNTIQKAIFTENKKYEDFR